MHTASNLRGISLRIAGGIVRFEGGNKDRGLGPPQVLFVPLGPQALRTKNDLWDYRHPRLIGNAGGATFHAADFKAAGNCAFRKHAHELAVLSQLYRLAEGGAAIDTVNWHVVHGLQQRTCHRGFKDSSFSQEAYETLLAIGQKGAEKEIHVTGVVADQHRAALIGDIFFPRKAHF